jgi:excisionase family DNA binding protein
MESDVLTTGEVAKLCGVTPDAVLKWVKTGKLPATRTAGGHYRVARSDCAALGLGGLGRSESGAQAVVPAEPRGPMRCWEFYGSHGAPLETCRTCLAYLARAQNCYQLAELGEQAGHQRIFCRTDCEECSYYRARQGMATAVLVITRDEALTRRLTKQIDASKMSLRFARSGYESSTLMDSFRPAVVVMDSDLPEVREGLLPETIMQDDRIRGVRVFVALREGDEITVGQLSAPTIGAPFTAKQLQQLAEGAAIRVGGASGGVA